VNWKLSRGYVTHFLYDVKLMWCSYVCNNILFPQTLTHKHTGQCKDLRFYSFSLERNWNKLFCSILSTDFKIEVHNCLLLEVVSDKKKKYIITKIHGKWWVTNRSVILYNMELVSSINVASVLWFFDVKSFCFIKAQACSIMFKSMVAY
jgi:hypothetical protein